MAGTVARSAAAASQGWMAVPDHLSCGTIRRSSRARRRTRRSACGSVSRRRLAAFPTTRRVATISEPLIRLREARADVQRQRQRRHVVLDGAQRQLGGQLISWLVQPDSASSRISGGAVRVRPRGRTWRTPACAETGLTAAGPPRTPGRAARPQRTRQHIVHGRAAGLYRHNDRPSALACRTTNSSCVALKTTDARVRVGSRNRKPSPTVRS